MSEVLNAPLATKYEKCKDRKIILGQLVIRHHVVTRYMVLRSFHARSGAEIAKLPLKPARQKAAFWTILSDLGKPYTQLRIKYIVITDVE